MCFSGPQSLFPLEKQQEAETDEDEDTAANNAQLAEWEGVEPPAWEGAEPVDSEEEDGDSFGGSDGINGDGNIVSPEKDAAVSKASPRWVCGSRWRCGLLGVAIPPAVVTVPYRGGVVCVWEAEILSAHDLF